MDENIDDKVSRSDIYALYDIYHSYRTYYEFYWAHDRSKGKTRQEVRNKIEYILKNGQETGTAFDYLCWYAGLNPYDVKDMNGIDVLRAIERENYVD